jgi:hypothetical protein
MTLVVERPAPADAEVLEYLDFDPLTAVYVARAVGSDLPERQVPDAEDRLRLLESG